MRPQNSNKLFHFVIFSGLGQMLNQLLDVVVVVIGRIDFLYFFLGEWQFVVLFCDLFPLVVSFGFSETFVDLYDFCFGCDFLVDFLIVKLNNLLNSHILVHHFLFECVKQVLKRIYEKIHPFFYIYFLLTDNLFSSMMSSLYTDFY